MGRRELAGAEAELELAALRGLRGQAAAVAPGDSIPIVINLFDGDDEGNFRRQLEAAGATLGRYDADLLSYRAVATGPVIDRIIGFDFVLFVELIGLAYPTLDESAPLIDADLIRPGTTTYGIPRFGGYSIPVGIMDSGFRMGWDGHDDLYFKEGCARNFTDDGLSAFNDQIGHGTLVLGIIAGTGSANSRYRGMAPSVGLLGGGGIRAAKIFKKDATRPEGWQHQLDMAAMDWLALPQDECGFPMPLVVNYSGGGHGRRPDRHGRRVQTARPARLHQSPAVRGRRRQPGTECRDHRQTRRGQECAHRRQRARLRRSSHSA